MPYFHPELEVLPMPRARNSETAGVFIPGQLSYLPKRPNGEPVSLLSSEVPDGCFDHPVVILSTDQRKREAVVLILTSLRGKSLDEYSPISSVRAFHLPIHPSPVHPDNGVLLFLDEGLELRKKTYVKTEFQRSISWELLQPEYREQRTGKQCRLRPDSFAKLLDYIGLEAPVRHGKSKALKLPRHVSVDYTLGWDLPESIKANNLAQYGSINRPTVPPPRVPEWPRVPEQPMFSVGAPRSASTLQSVAPSREGAAAEVDRDISQRREAQSHEVRSILPRYSSTPQSDNVSDSDDSPSIWRKLVIFLLVMVGVFLTRAWWQCQLSVCK